MPDVKEMQKIRVLNYGVTFKNLETDRMSYTFSGAVDGVPTVNYIPFTEIEHAHTRSPVFKTGMLVFDPEMQEDIYSALRMPNWKDTVWFESTIDDVLLNPTPEAMKRIVAVQDLATIDRIRARMLYFTNTGERDVLSRVVDIVNKRYNEIMSGRSHTDIVIKDVEEFKLKEPDPQTKALLEQNELLKQQLDSIMLKLGQKEGQGAAKTAAESGDGSAVGEQDTKLSRRGRPSKADK